MNTEKQSNPQTELNKILEIIGKIAKISADGDYVFRGESQCHPKVSSSLYRALEKIGLFNEHNVETFQRQELNYTKRYRYTQETDKFKILTEIQHFSGKTNLLDFTTDYLIALFFACDSFPFKDGRIILQDKNGMIKNLVVEPYDPDPKSRVKVQKSIFVRPPEGFIRPHEDDIITIPANLKYPMLEHLQNHHGISAETIYPDLHGFVSSQEGRWKIYEEISKGNDHLESGQKTEDPQEKSKNYQKAIQYFTNAIDNSIQLDEGLASAYEGRGSAYVSIGEFDNSKDKFVKAIGDFTEAIKHKLNYSTAYNNRGRAYCNKGEFENAIADFSKAIELMPRFAEAYHRRGLAYFSKGDFDGAITDLSEAICLNPDDAVAYHRRGVVYLKNGDFDNAIVDLDKVIKMDPNDDLVYYSRGETWLHLRKWHKAKADLIAAEKKGVDITALFHNSYKRIEDFEQKISAELPEDITSMLTWPYMYLYTDCLVKFQTSPLF